MDTTIQLGSFVFQGLEIPEKINFGGSQQLAQHDLIGGNRVVDAIGKSDIDISWSGLMTGSTALTRAQQINQLRVAGKQIQLKWFNLIYNVIIQNFISYTERYYQVSYEIVLRVITDGSNPVSKTNLTGFNQAIANDAAQATKISNNLNISTVVTAINTLNAAIAAVPTLNGADPATIKTVLMPLTSAITAVKTAITPISQRLFGTNA